MFITHSHTMNYYYNDFIFAIVQIISSANSVNSIWRLIKLIFWRCSVVSPGLDSIPGDIPPTRPEFSLKSWQQIFNFIVTQTLCMWQDPYALPVVIAPSTKELALFGSSLKGNVAMVMVITGQTDWSFYISK